MVSKHTDRLSLNDDGSTSSNYDPYFRLKEDNILFEEDGIIKFCLEPFFEWLLAEHSRLRRYTAEEIKDLLKQSGYLASYWRAAGISLVARKKHITIGELITFDEPKLDIFLVDSLSATIVEYPKSTIKILGKLVRSRGDQKKAEIAILAIYQIFSKYSDKLDTKARNHLIKFYIRGLRSPNEFVSDLARQHLALLWDNTTTRAVGETIIHRIAEKVGFFYLSFLGLRRITRIGIGRERTVTVLLDMTLLIIGEHLENESKFREFLNHIKKPLTLLLPLLKLKFAKKFIVNMIVKGYRDTEKQDYAGNYKEIKYMLEEPENRHFIKWLAQYFVSPSFFQKEKEILDGAKLNNGMVAWLLEAAFTVRANNDNDVDRTLHLMEGMFKASDQMISQWNAIRSLFRIYIANYYLAKYKSESTCLNKMNMERIEAKFYEFSEEFVARNTGSVYLKSNKGERRYKDTTLYYSFLIDGLAGRNSFRLLNRCIRQARDEKNLEFLENIHESVSKAGGWKYYEIALNELQQPIHENLKAITNQQIADSYSGKECKLLVGTLANIRGRYKENVDNFLKMIEEESRVTGDVPPDAIEKLIKEIQNTRMKLDMRLFRTVYGQLVYFKMAMFYPECIKIFSEALDEAIDQKTVENFFYCFIEHFSGWLLREHYERAAEGK